MHAILQAASEAVATFVEQAAERCRGEERPAEEDPEWGQLFAFLAAVRQRSTKGQHPRSAMKGG